jgi:hypothetical protein
VSDTLAIFLCLIAALIIAAYYFRIKRTTKLLGDGKANQSLKTRWLRWSDRIVIAAGLLLVVGFFLLRSVFILWVSISVLIIALILGQIIKSIK